MRNVNNQIRLMQGITDRPAAVRGGKIKLISYRTSPIGTTLKAANPLRTPRMQPTLAAL